MQRKFFEKYKYFVKKVENKKGEVSTLSNCT